jgi:hypothetical protein
MKRKLLLAALVSTSIPFRALALSKPDPVLTPGAVVTVPVSVLCKPGYSKLMRHTTTATKKHVCAVYHKRNCPGPKWELDHLISLEIGGADTELNLFPQPIEEARKKDVIENRLKREVCSGKTKLPAAQKRVQEWWKE